MFKQPLFAGLLAVLPLAVMAENPVELETDTIIVTATRSEISVSDAIVPVTVISREQIEQSLATDLAEILRFEAGLDLGRNGGPGQSTSIFLRGTESNHTLVMIDGVRINPGTIGGAAIQNIAPEIIERIEIVKGPRSALFGSDAIGGVINIITRRPQGSTAVARLGIGSFGTRSGFLSSGQQFAAGELAASVNWQQTDGFSPLAASDINRGYENLSINLSGLRKFGDTTIALRHWQAAGTMEYLDFFQTPVDQDFRNASTALEIGSDLGTRGYSKLITSYVVDDISQNQGEDFVESQRLALDWQHSVELASHTLVGGLYVMREKASTLSFGSGFGETTNVNAVFLEDQWVGDDNRVLVAARLTDHESFGDEITWNVEFAHIFNDAWKLTSGIGHAFRAPDATDRFGFGGNQELQPEVADEIQLGLHFRPSDQHSFEMALYRNNIHDLIDFDWATFELHNINKAKIRGAQLTYEYSGDIFSIRADAVRQNADNATDGSRLLRRAEKSLSLKVLRRIGQHSVGLSLLANGRREDFNNTLLPGYALTNLIAESHLAGQWTLSARIQNLLNVDYETAAGFNMEERSFYLDVSYRWD